MKTRKFYMVDVFAENKYSGNQLAVFPDAADMSKQEMQCLAKEINFSETTFILSQYRENSRYKVRIFTPEKEVPFAGHPTLGTAFIIQKEFIQEQVKEIILDLKAGLIPVSVTYEHNKPDMFCMKQKSPRFGKTIDQKIMAEALSLKTNDFMGSYPIQEVSTGLPFLIVALKSLKAVKQSCVQREIFFDVIKDLKAKAVLIFTDQTLFRENQLHARVFADYFGVPEDPATGSANGCLAAYLAKHDFFNKPKISIQVEQGYEIKRPSRLYLKAHKRDESIDVYVGGKVFLTARGEFV
ncbi:MAG: PhzF family phenazine biosynthesis isomerase [Candidatus Aminicenantes bacterium]|nr:PhzF family phenazine biosynthesis isomerase [Candidatus Aminicenantes bacterium]